MNTTCHKRSGFTLIELVATLLLGGVLTMGGAALIVYVVQGYNTALEHAGLAQGIELAMGRLVREVRHADTIGGGGTSITFTRGGVARVFSLTGGTLQMQVGGVSYPLMRNVAGFAVQRTPASGSEVIRFTITPAGAGPVFSTGHFVVVDES
jgi:prepilin-type N-terminal cleavage/methylation domain-containing protein